MRRWNGWGDEKTTYRLPESGREYLADHIGYGDTSPDASLENILKDIPPGRLPDLPLVSSQPFERLMHARGQSLTDWVALRTGRLGIYPDGVAYPACDEDVRTVLDYASDCQAQLIPYGGGTSVLGHINPLETGRPVLTVDLSRLDRLVSLDHTSHLAVIEAGACGPKIEQQLSHQGFTLGHFPQSFELSTLGGWIATRSCGQQSYHYGRIENLFAGGHLETPVGPLELPPFPASAAGPDLRQIILGSEGRFGIITRAVMRVRTAAPSEAFFGAFFQCWEDGVEAVRAVAQERIPLSMARLSNARETETTLMLSGKSSLIPWIDRGLRLLRYGAGRCLLIFGITGDENQVTETRNKTNEVILEKGGLFTGTMAGKTWQKSRFLSPYLRNSLWDSGYAVDTLETALPWTGIPQAADEIISAIQNMHENASEHALVLCHLSHIYEDGASIYITYIFRRMPDPDFTVELWKAMKSAASQAILRCGGTISHQHGVGIDHKSYLNNEKGAVGITVIERIAQTFDPHGILNSGKLVDLH